MVVVGVAMDEDAPTVVPPFLKKHPMNYQVAVGSPALAQQYSLDDVGLPVTLVFDKSGKQVKRFNGLLKEADLRAAVQAAM